MQELKLVPAVPQGLAMGRGVAGGAEHHPRNRAARGDSGVTLSHGASPASSLLQGGGGRNFLLAPAL